MVSARVPRRAAVALLLALLASGSVVFAHPAAAADPERIMPLGDSLTHGWTVPGGYRIALEDHLAAATFSFDFVGSQENGPPELADRHHEGHPGYTISEVAASVDGWLDAQRPSVVSLMIGTNDLEVPTDVGAAVARLSALVDQITGHPAGAHLLVATIPPQADPGANAQVDQFNTQLPGVVDHWASLGRTVSLVDARARLTAADLADGQHLTSAGYSKVADAWYNGLRQIYPALPPPSDDGTVLVADSFERPDGSSLGSAEVGGAWMPYGVTWGISGGKAAALRGGGEGVALIDAGTADVEVTARLTLSPTAASPGLSLRALDQRNQLLVGLVRRSNADRVSLYRISNGRYTLLAERTGVGLVLGGTYQLTVRAEGAVLDVSLNGAALFQHTLSAADQTAFGARTAHGLRTYLKKGTEDGASRWDDFSIQGAAPVPPPPPPPPPPDNGSVLVADSFERPDGSALGSAEVGGAWMPYGVTWGISGGKAAALTGGGEGVALIDAGAADVEVAARLTLSRTAASPGLSLRALDQRNQLLVGLVRRSNADRVSLYRISNGGYTLLAERSGVGLVLGGTYQLTVRAEGAVLDVSLDGAALFQHTLSAADQTAFGARTAHGLRTYLKQGTDDGASRWDDFTIRSSS